MVAVARLVLEAAAGPKALLRVWESPAPMVARPSAHPGVELAWVDEGSLAYGIGSARHEVTAGGVMLVPSEVEHATSFLSAMRGAALQLDRDLVAEVGDAIGARGLAAGPVCGIGGAGGAARVAALGAMIADELRRGTGDPGGLLAVDAMLEAMVATALRPAPRAANETHAAWPNDPAIAAAVRFIEASYAEPLTVDAIAKSARMSRFHFSRRFRDATGRSPYGFLQDVRLGRAAELLRRGRHGVTETAFSVGFTDPSRFARAFRARFGEAPARWASQRRATVAASLAVTAR